MDTKRAVKRKNSSAEVNVDWHVEKKCNADRARHMFETSLYSDCEFLVGIEDDKEVIIYFISLRCSISNVCLHFSW